MNEIMIKTMSLIEAKLTGVYEVQQHLKDLSLHSKNLHLLLIRLTHSPREQSREVWAAGSEDQAVDSEDPAPDL